MIHIHLQVLPQAAISVAMSNQIQERREFLGEKKRGGG